MSLLKKIKPKSVHLDIMPTKNNVTNVTILVKNVLDLKPSIVSESKNPKLMNPPVLNLKSRSEISRKPTQISMVNQLNLKKESSNKSSEETTNQDITIEKPKNLLPPPKKCSILGSMTIKMSIRELIRQSNPVNKTDITSLVKEIKCSQLMDKVSEMKVPNTTISIPLKSLPSSPMKKVNISPSPLLMMLSSLSTIN